MPLIVIQGDEITNQTFKYVVYRQIKPIVENNTCKGLQILFYIEMNFKSFHCDPQVSNENDFDWKLNIMDKFVKGVLIGNDTHQKGKMVVKLQSYLEMAQILVGNQGDFEEQIQSKNHKTIHLPDEILLNIMTYLNIKDLLGSMSLVNKHFYNLTCESSAIECITLKRIDDPTKLENAMKVLKRSKTIKHAIVTQCDQ